MTDKMKKLAEVLVGYSVDIQPGEKHEKCRYGCNRRLVKFNQLVADELV